MSLIDPEQHAHLIKLQHAVNRGYAALDEHAPGVRGQDLSEEQRAEVERLRQEVSETVLALRAALFDSGLPGEHGYCAASQALKDAVREIAEPEEG